MAAANAHSDGKAILVIGGGISGVTAALEAAETGYRVYLVEKEPSLGGRVARNNKYYPKLCPPSCGMEINFKRIKKNPNIKVYTMAEVEKVSGSEGDYEVTVKVSPRFVNENCTACGKCAEACETEIPNEFNLGMDKTKAAYLPHPMAYPQRYVIDPSIVGTDEGKKVKEACTYDAVDLDMKEETVKVSVGGIVVATGWRPFDVARVENLGFGKYKNVITNVMMERLASPSGPTGGKILRPSDNREPKNVVFAQCAGSRDENYLPYCSGVCCLASMKQATYLRDQYGDSRATIFYIDVRAVGRFEDFYTKVQKDEKITFVKGKVAKIEEDPVSNDLIIEVEDTLSGNKIKEKADMVVLATGMVPNEVKASLDASFDEFGFILADPSKRGVYGAGCARRPVSVSQSVQDATGSALKAIQSARR
jgi:quinone-modifying oxidoreductase subunit QmoA